MLLRLITGRLTITAAILSIAGSVIYMFASHSYDQKKRDQAAINQFAPALNQLNTDHLTVSDWRYTGPAGTATLRFYEEGTLTLIHDDGSESAGSWSITGSMLNASISNDSGRFSYCPA